MHYCSAIRVEGGLLSWMRYYVVCVHMMHKLILPDQHACFQGIMPTCGAMYDESARSLVFLCQYVCFYECVCACAFILCLHSPTQSCPSTFKLFACLHVRVWWGKLGLSWKHARTYAHTPGEVREATHMARRRSWQNNFDEQAKVFRPNVSHLLCFWCLFSFILSLTSPSSSMYNHRTNLLQCNLMQCAGTRWKRVHWSKGKARINYIISSDNFQRWERVHVRGRVKHHYSVCLFLIDMYSSIHTHTCRIYRRWGTRGCKLKSPLH